MDGAHRASPLVVVTGIVIDSRRVGAPASAVCAVQRLTWAYLRTELYPGDPAWREARDALAAGPDPIGRVESK